MGGKLHIAPLFALLTGAVTQPIATTTTTGFAGLGLPLYATRESAKIVALVGAPAMPVVSGMGIAAAIVKALGGVMLQENVLVP